MAISNEDMLHGAVILQILESLEAIHPDIRYKINSDISRSAYMLLVKVESHVSEVKVGLYIKSSRSRLSPWRYTFTRSHQEEVLALQNQCDNVFTLFVAGEDGIAVVDYQLLKTILDDQFDDTEWVSVSRKLNEAYRVSGKDGKMESPLPRNAFPNHIVDYLRENTNAAAASDTPTNNRKEAASKPGLLQRLLKSFKK